MLKTHNYRIIKQNDKFYIQHKIFSKWIYIRNYNYFISDYLIFLLDLLLLSSFLYLILDIQIDNILSNLIFNIFVLTGLSMIIHAIVKLYPKKYIFYDYQKAYFMIKILWSKKENQL